MQYIVLRGVALPNKLIDCLNICDAGCSVYYNYVDIARCKRYYVIFTRTEFREFIALP